MRRVLEMRRALDSEAGKSLSAGLVIASHAGMRQTLDSEAGKLSDTIWDNFVRTRARTLKLAETLEVDDFVVQTATYMSPPKWHIGHVSWLYEVIMSSIDNGYRFYSKEFSEYLNSYYNQFGEPHQKGRRGTVSRPTLNQILDYYTEINRRVRTFLHDHNTDDKNIVNLFEMGLNHECQHQELLVYDLQHLLADVYVPSTKVEPPGGVTASPSMIPVQGGMYRMGYNGNRFCYDIELPEHDTYTHDYTIGRFPVTNAEYMRFIEDGGYSTFENWLSDGWKAVQDNKWNSPMYWEKVNDTWYIQDFRGKRPINPAEPVVHVSFYEADAYARWAGKRLPTEAEWEKAACYNPEYGTKTTYPWGNEPPNDTRCNLLESYVWGCTNIGSYPDGASPCGCEQMVGDVWEWTSSEFVGYRGFQSAFSEYNDKWFTGQKVLRGGSYGTPSMSIRASYRNFFRLDERWMFAGFRLASDA